MHLLFILFTIAGFNDKLNNTIIIPDDATIHEVSIQKGDGIITLMQRYELNNQTANVDAFYALNKLKQNEALKLDRKYKLPILIYKYDGKSIRSTLKIEDINQALRIQKYNENIHRKSLRMTDFRDSRILWVPYHEFITFGVKSDNKKEDFKTSSEADLKTEAVVENKPEKNEINPSKELLSAIESTPSISPKVTTSSSYDYLGKDHKNVKVSSDRLANSVFYVVSGHGGPDPGAICTDCKHRLCEDEYAYDVAARVAKKLLEQGAIVEMVIQDKSNGIRNDQYLKCDKTETLADGSKIPFNHVERLEQRTQYVNTKYDYYKKKGIKDQRMISIHIDSNSESHNQDVFFCYYKNSEASRDLASRVHKVFESKYAEHQKNRGYTGKMHEKAFYVIKKTSPPAILIELGNIKNAKDHKRILNPENRDALAKWIVEGISY